MKQIIWIYSFEGLCCLVYVNLTQARVFGEEGASVKKMSPRLEGLRALTPLERSLEFNSQQPRGSSQPSVWGLWTSSGIQTYMLIEHSCIKYTHTKKISVTKGCNLSTQEAQAG